MLDLIKEKANDPQFLFAIAIAIAVVATILTVAMPLLETDTLGKRMKAVSVERDRIRTRERERRAKNQAKAALRPEAKAFMKQIVDQFSLSKWLGTEQAKKQLVMAGFHHGQQSEVAFLFFRLVTPIVLFSLAVFYLFVVAPFDYPFIILFGGTLLAAYIGIKAPELFLKNRIQKRQVSIRRAFPDALDLLLICVESGMSVEIAIQKVANEIGKQSIPLAEELTLTTAELSYLPDRRIAFENFGLRTGVEAVRQIATVLIQSERYGTPLGSALRVVSQESRETRLMMAEKKAAALPPKLTVPMILFFLPVLFAVIISPAIIQVLDVWK